jgi:methionyl-tRNA formyltransferase
VIADVNEPSFLRRVAPGDHGIVTGFNQIFSTRAIEKFASLVNLHSSLLPYYRGPSPAYWCIEYGERMTGYTLHEVDASIDSGRILYQEVVPIDGERDPSLLTARIAAAAGATFTRYLDHLRTGSSWEPRVVDAAAVYSKLVNYRSFGPHGA